MLEKPRLWKIGTVRSRASAAASELGWQRRQLAGVRCEKQSWGERFRIVGHGQAIRSIALRLRIRCDYQRVSRTCDLRFEIERSSWPARSYSRHARRDLHSASNCCHPDPYAVESTSSRRDRSRRSAYWRSSAYARLAQRFDLVNFPRRWSEPHAAFVRRRRVRADGRESRVGWFCESGARMNAITFPARATGSSPSHFPGRFEASLEIAHAEHRVIEPANFHFDPVLPPVIYYNRRYLRHRLQRSATRNPAA